MKHCDIEQADNFKMIKDRSDSMFRSLLTMVSEYVNENETRVLIY